MGGEWGVGASLALESVSPQVARPALGAAAGRLRDRQPARGPRVPLRLPGFALHFGPTDGWRGMFFLGGLPALLSLFIRVEGEGVRGVARAPDRLGDLPAVAVPELAALRCTSSSLMAMMNFISHGTQDMYPTLPAAPAAVRARAASPNITMMSMFGAVLGGLVFGYYSDRAGRRKAMIIAVVCGPGDRAALDRRAQRPRLIVVGVFLMQFFVQGAWGVMPAHINELSPGDAARVLPRLRVSARRAVRLEHHLLRGGRSASTSPTRSRWACWRRR